MTRRSLLVYTAVVLPALLAIAQPARSDVSGFYLETRTCQVYTGPCFANGETGLAGREAIMAWGIDKGKRDGVDISGLNVVVVVNASDTLACKGIEDARQVKSMVIVDGRATAEQRDALLAFVRSRNPRVLSAATRIESQKIDMSLDRSTLRGSLKAGKAVTLETRKAKPGDCICSNETAFYPPLTKVDNYAPGVALESSFKGRGLQTRWASLDTRSAYMATFEAEQK